MKEFDYSTVKHYKLYNFIKTVFRPLVKVLFHLKVKGLENLPKEVVSNIEYVLLSHAHC